jgi:hypothetical protein
VERAGVVRRRATLSGRPLPWPTGAVAVLLVASLPASVALPPAPGGRRGREGHALVTGRGGAVAGCRRDRGRRRRVSRPTRRPRRFRPRPSMLSPHRGRRHRARRGAPGHRVVRCADRRVRRLRRVDHRAAGRSRRSVDPGRSGCDGVGGGGPQGESGATEAPPASPPDDPATAVEESGPPTGPSDSERLFAEEFPVHAAARQTDDPATHGWALLVGVNRYQGRTRDTFGSVADVAVLREVLLAHGWATTTSSS